MAPEKVSTAIFYIDQFAAIMIDATLVDWIHFDTTDESVLAGREWFLHTRYVEPSRD